MNGFATVLRLVIRFVILTDLTKVLLSFQVLGEISMDEGIRSKKSLSLAIPVASQTII